MRIRPLCRKYACLPAHVCIRSACVAYETLQSMKYIHTLRFGWGHVTKMPMHQLKGVFMADQGMHVHMDLHTLYCGSRSLCHRCKSN